MANRFVRSSKYRHVFGRPTRKEQCYDNLRVSTNAWDTNLIKANPTYLSVNWEVSGGGAFAVIPLSEKGRLPEQLPLFRGHTAVVLDTDWNPFDDSIVASGSDDGKAFIWRVPENFSLYTDEEEVQDVSPVSKLVGHSRKVGHVLFNPAAANILATSSGDYTIKLWDIEVGLPRLTLKHVDVVQSLSWSANGALMVTTSRDKKLRIWDTRQQAPVHTGAGHAGAKNSRSVWMGEHDRIATTGFSKMSDRQLGLWDLRNATEPLGGFQMLDSISGVCMPFWDDSTSCLYLAGKGDGNIRYFEYENDKFEYLSEYKSADPQRGIAFIPKRGLNMHENEVMRGFKTVNDSYVEPISFIVPRRSEAFQDDIYPPVFGGKPAISAAEWFNGKEGIPPKIDMEGLYDGKEPTEVPADYKPTKAPVAASAPPMIKKEPEIAKAPPQASPVFHPPPSMKEQSASISHMASKFADEEPEHIDDDDTSSFEEITKPIDRSEWQSKLSKPAAEKEQSSSTSRAIGASAMEKPSLPTINKPLQHNETSATSNESSSSFMKLPLTPAAGTEHIQGYLEEIKSLLKQQNATMTAQNDRISQLTSEVDAMKTGTTSGTTMSKEERIKELERQLAELRQ